MGPKARFVGSNRRAYDTVFSSEVGLNGFESTDDPADVEISLGKAPDRLKTVTGSGMFWTANVDEVLINTPGIARYHVNLW